MMYVVSTIEFQCMALVQALVGGCTVLIVFMHVHNTDTVHAYNIHAV